MVKVTVLGAAGGIGQPLSLLLKLSPYISTLALYDIRLAPGVAQDLSHINTNCSCKGYKKEEAREALQGAHVVIIPAGVPRKPGMTRDDLFKINAGIVKQLISQVGQYAPEARILIISNPVNSTVPIAVETLKQLGKFQAGKVMGVTTLDLVRAETFLAEMLGSSHYSKEKMKGRVTVVGGHSGNTIVPLVRDKKYLRHLRDKHAWEQYMKRVQFGGDEVVKAKDGAGSATLSMALAGYAFAEKVLKSLHLETTETAPSFVYLPGITGGKEVQKKLGTDVEYFAVPVVFYRGTVVGLDSRCLDEMDPEERGLVDTCLKELSTNIDKGKQFVIGGSKL